MENLLNRYRNITVLLLTIFGQLILLGYQVKSGEDVRFVRVWAVTIVTPLARTIEGLRSASVGVFENYFVLRNLRDENLRIKAEVGRLKVENQFLRSELETSERAKVLSAFQARTPSKTLAARVFGTGAGANSKVIFVDRGTRSGVQKGMAVITPDGIAGKILAAFPTASQVMLATDPDFAAGVVSQKHQVKGTLKGLGYANGRIDYVPAEEPVEVGEMFYTSGDDRIFPKGFAAAVVRVVRPGNPFKEIIVEPAGLRHGLEEVLILLSGIHQPLPELQAAEDQEVHLNSPVPAPPAGAVPDALRTGPGTDADRLRDRYQDIGAAQKHTFGEGLPGSKPPDFNLKTPPRAAGSASSPGSTQPAAAAGPPASPGTAPAAAPQTPAIPTAAPAPPPDESRKTPAPKPPSAQPNEP
jgi:rod shape-determining protein MreC